MIAAAQNQVMATPSGPLPTVTVFTHVLVEVLMTFTCRAAVGDVGVAPVGGDGDPEWLGAPTSTVFTTVLVEVLMTLTVPVYSLVT